MDDSDDECKRMTRVVIGVATRFVSIVQNADVGSELSGFLSSTGGCAGYGTEANGWCFVTYGGGAAQVSSANTDPSHPPQCQRRPARGLGKLRTQYLWF